MVGRSDEYGHCCCVVVSLVDVAEIRGGQCCGLRWTGLWLVMDSVLDLDIVL